MKWGVDASTSEGVARAVAGIFKTGALTSVSDTKTDFFFCIAEKEAFGKNSRQGSSEKLFFAVTVFAF